MSKVDEILAQIGPINMNDKTRQTADTAKSQLLELLVSEAVSCEFIVDDNGFRVTRIRQKAIPLEAIKALFGVEDE